MILKFKAIPSTWQQVLGEEKNERETQFRKSIKISLEFCLDCEFLFKGWFLFFASPPKSWLATSEKSANFISSGTI